MGQPEFRSVCRTNILIVAMGVAATMVMGITVAQAQQKNSPTTTSVADNASDSKLNARENFALGQKAYEAKDYQVADSYFKKAYDLKPHPSALKMIAECKLQLGQTAAAATILEQLIADPDYKKKRGLKRRLNKAKKEVGVLVIDSNPQGANIHINGEVMEDKTPTRVYVESGAQSVVLLMDDYAEQIVSVSVGKNKKEKIFVDYSELTPIAAVPIVAPPVEQPAPEPVPESVVAEEPVVDEPEPLSVDEGAEPIVEEDAAIVEEESDGPPKAFWATAAIAGVGIVSGTVFGTMALRDQKDYEDTGDSATRDSGKRAAVIADISFGVAIVAAITGTIILISNKNKRERASISKKNAKFYFHPSAGKDAAGFSTGLWF